jgi:ABC-2 type transport system permease protein
MRSLPRFARFATIETKLFLRDPATWVVALLLPTIILVILGLIFGTEPDPEMGGNRFIDLFIPSLVVITLATLASNVFTIRLASYREKGYLRRLSTTPARPWMLLVVQVVISLVAAVVAVGLLAAVGHVAFDVPLPLDPLGFAVALLLGMSSLTALAMLIAAVAPSAGAATTIGILLFVSVMFLGGVYLPRQFLPDVIIRIGEFVPPGVEGLSAAWTGAGPTLLPLVTMAVITLVAGGIAARTFRWE